MPSLADVLQGLTDPRPDPYGNGRGACDKLIDIMKKYGLDGGLLSAGAAAQSQQPNTGQ